MNIKESVKKIFEGVVEDAAVRPSSNESAKIQIEKDLGQKIETLWRNRNYPGCFLVQFEGVDYESHVTDLVRRNEEGKWVKGSVFQSG